VKEVDMDHMGARERKMTTRTTTGRRACCCLRSVPLFGEKNTSISQQLRGEKSGSNAKAWCDDDSNVDLQQ
jgi:hypothetical protein